MIANVEQLITYCHAPWVGNFPNRLAVSGGPGDGNAQSIKWMFASYLLFICRNVGLVLCMYVLLAHPLTHFRFTVGSIDRIAFPVNRRYIYFCNKHRAMALFLLLLLLHAGSSFIYDTPRLMSYDDEVGPLATTSVPQRCLGFGWQTPLSICFLWVFSPCHCRLFFLYVAHRKRIKASGGSD